MNPLASLSHRAGKLFALVMLIAGLPMSAFADDDTASNAVTWARDVAPIVHAQCAQCHRPGQIGPMSLLEYGDVRPWAKSIKKAVADRTMPPWHADPAYGKFANESRLSDREVAAIVSWVEQGAPSGNLDQAPAHPKFEDDRFIFGKPDEVFEMPPYKVADAVEDHYEHVIIENKNTEDRWITATEIRPGAANMVHHVLVFLVPRGMEASNLFDPGIMMKSSFVTGWGPGTNPVTYPEGYGKLLPAGMDILFQIHYHKEPGPGTGGVDRSALGVKYTSKPLEHPTTTAWVMDPTFSIPPGAKNYESISSFKFIDDGWVLGLVPHMHLRGKDFKFEAEYPDGRSEILLFVPKFDFNWQIAYELVEPKLLPKGTVVKAIAHWDNSAENPNNPDPNATVYFGEATTDEMMIGFMEYAYVNRKNAQGKFGLPESLGGGGLAIFGGGGASGEATSRVRERMDSVRSKRQRERTLLGTDQSGGN